MAFGKRMRIANAIADLRRPPSVNSFDHNPPLRSNSQAQSVSRSFTGSSSTRQSLNSPFAMSHAASPPPGSAGIGMSFSPESPPHTGDIVGTPAESPRRDSDPGGRPPITVTESQGTIGLGLGIPDALYPGRSASAGIPQALIPGKGVSK